MADHLSYSNMSGGAGFLNRDSNLDRLSQVRASNIIFYIYDL